MKQQRDKLAVRRMMMLQMETCKDPAVFVKLAKIFGEMFYPSYNRGKKRAKNKATLEVDDLVQQLEKDARKTAVKPNGGA